MSILVNIVPSIIALIVPFIMYYLDKRKERASICFETFESMLEYNQRLFFSFQYVTYTKPFSTDLDLFEELFHMHFNMYFRFRSMFYENVKQKLKNYFEQIDLWYGRFSSEYIKGHIKLEWDSFFDIVKLERSLLSEINKQYHYGLNWYFFGDCEENENEI